MLIALSCLLTGRYQELINGGLSVSGFNRRYLVVPIGRAPDVFHPKLYLALGEKRADGLVGSSNCTNAGIAYNMELCSAFAVCAERPDGADEVSRSVLRQVYESMKSFAADAGALKDTLEAQFFIPVEDQFPWLHRETTLPAAELEVLHSHNSALWEQVTTRLAKTAVRNITIIAPFYDKDLGFLRQVREHWPTANLTIVAQQNYATLDGTKLSKLLDASKKNRLLVANPRPGRRLHAKAFAFETDAGTYWLTGSPNATLAAFDGRNTEAALWLKSKEGPKALLEDAGLRLREVEPSEFEAGAEQEPRNGRAPDRDINLYSALLTEQGALECEVELSARMRGMTLRVRNCNELYPVLSLPVRGAGRSALSLDLDENQVAQIRGAAICEIKGTTENGRETISNGVALIQLYHLLKKRPAAGNGRDTLRTITETGENLVPYVDSLGSVREAVEFFNHCNVRFYDGDVGIHSRRFDWWKPRDSFKPDTPINWLNIPAGSSAKDLHDAIWEFVERHQRKKLYRHTRRGNLNGLANFLDIFRTLNGLLLTYHARVMEGTSVVPFAFVITGIMRNLMLLIGRFDPAEEDEFEGNGFIAAIYANFRGDREAVRGRLGEERVPQMLRAAVEAMVDVRMKARKIGMDPWAISRLRWISNWIAQQGLQAPTSEEVRAAGLEYTAVAA